MTQCTASIVDQNYEGILRQPYVVMQRSIEMLIRQDKGGIKPRKMQRDRTG